MMTQITTIKSSLIIRTFDEYANGERTCPAQKNEKAWDNGQCEHPRKWKHTNP